MRASGDNFAPWSNFAAAVAAMAAVLVVAAEPSNSIHRPCPSVDIP